MSSRPTADDTGMAPDQSLATPQMEAQGEGAETAHPDSGPTTATRRPDATDLLLALLDRIGSILALLALLLLGASVAYLGAICVTTALLRRSAAAQAFFVDLLITMTWSGYAILFVIGFGIALSSVTQLVLWPGGRLWRWLAQRLGRPVAWAATLLWATTVVGEALLAGWGFELWARDPYIQALTALRLAPTPDGLLVISVLAAPIIALLPEWCARVGLGGLVRVWQSAQAAVRASVSAEE